MKSTPAQRKITVLLADDHCVAREGIRVMLAQAKDMDIVGEAQDGFEVQKLVPKLCPQVLLLDLKMPGPSPAALEKWVRENCPETITLVLTAHDRDAYLAAMMEAGVSGYLCKTEKAEQLIQAIRRAVNGEILFDHFQIERAKRWREEVEDKTNQLSAREYQVLQLIAKGYDNKLIATELSITIKTAMYHTTNLFKKLGIKNRQEATIWALKHLSDDLEESPG